MSNLPLVPTPSADQVQKYLTLWRESDNEKVDTALRATFEAMPQNADVGKVAVKIAALNGLYSTNILGVVQVARHIVSLDIDAALTVNAVNPTLIEDIANVRIGGKGRRNYSFATNHCIFHRPDAYPIYDSLVAGVLNGLLKQGESFDTFTRGEHWATDYAIWCRSIMMFRTHYGLEEFSIREVDKYLWMLAKERKAMRAAGPTVQVGYHQLLDQLPPR